MTIAQDARAVALDLDRAGDVVLGGPADETMSQSLGLLVLSGVWWAPLASAILSVIMNERHHAVRALYGDDGAPLFPERMPAGAEKTNPYPGPSQAIW